MTVKPNISVAVLTYNRAAVAIRAVQSIALDPRVSSISVFDDGSDRASVALFRRMAQQHPSVKIFETDYNLGYCANLQKALACLSNADTEFSFLCESDMLLAPGWGEMANQAFLTSPESVALSVMLHRDQCKAQHCSRFRSLCLNGKADDASSVPAIIPFGSCYTEYPDRQKPVECNGVKLFYVASSIGTIMFRTSFLESVNEHFKSLNDYIGFEDAWLSWACFAYNNFSPKSLMVLDPGLALTIGREGLHGPMVLHNVRWQGSWWWRYPVPANISRAVCFLKYGGLTITNIKKIYRQLRLSDKVKL